MANRYWVGGTGTWTDTTHWSTTSGGISGASAPTSVDDAYFDANSFTAAGQTVTVAFTCTCKNIYWTGVTNNPTLSMGNLLNVYGSLTFAGGMTVTGNQNIVMCSTTTSNTINTAGVTIIGMELYGVGGGWTLQNNITTSSDFLITAGSFNTANYNITTSGFKCDGTYTRSLTLGSSTITCNSGAAFVNTGLTLNAGTSTFIMNSGNFYSNSGLTFYNITFNGNNLKIDGGSNTFNKLTLAASKTLTVMNSTITTVTDLDIGNSTTISATTSATLQYNGTVGPTNMGTGVTKTNIIVTAPNAPANKRYWVGGTGNWSDTNHWSVLSDFFGGASVPTSTTSVYFDVDSFTAVGQIVTVDVSTSCLDMNWTGAINTPTLNCTNVNSMSIYGSMTLISGMNVSGSYAGYFNFSATTTGKTITTAGKTCYHFTFSGVGGGWTLQDDVTITNGLSHRSGTLNTNSKNITCNFFESVTNTRTLTLGASVITSVTGLYIDNIPNLTFSCGTSKFITTGNSQTFTGAGLTYYDVEFQGNGTMITGANTFHKITLAASKVLNLTNSTTTTVADLDIGNNAIVNASISANLVYTSATAPTYMGTGVTETNIVVTAPSAPTNKRYWVGGTGNWSDTNHWSAFSGFFGGFSLPISTTNAYFNASSFTAAGQTVTADALTTCNDMDWTGVTNTPNFNNTVGAQQNIYGSLTLVSGMNITGAYGGDFNFYATTTGKTITTAGKTLYQMTFSGSGGGWTLQDDVTVTAYIYLLQGTLNTNSKNITSPIFDVCDTRTRTITLGSSIINLVAGTASRLTFETTTGLTYTANTATFRMNGAAALRGGTLKHNRIEILQNTAATMNCTVGTLKIANSTALTFTDSIVITADNLDIGNSATISATTSANLVYNGTTAPTNMGTGVTKTNITVTAPSAPANKRYWVGGTGNWSDTNHWSALSGFFGGFSVPTSTVSVYFDSDSFTTTGQKVTIDVSTAYCLDMDWTGATNSPIIQSVSGANETYIYGSVTFITNMSISGWIGPIWLSATTTGKTITTAGQPWDPMFNSSTGSWTLQDDFNTGVNNFVLGAGTLNTNNKTITTNTFNISTGSSSKTLNLGSSTVYCHNFVVSTASGTTLNAGTSKIILNSNSTSTGAGLTFYDIEFQSDHTLGDSFTCNKLIASGSKKITFTNSITTTVNDLNLGSGVTLYATTSATLRYNSAVAPTTSCSEIVTTGIVVTAPNAPANKRYWVSNWGYWSDTRHWSVLSGFFSGASVPVSTTNVYFDVDSFTTTGQNVYIDVAGNCNDMDWTGATNTPILYNYGGYKINIYGSLTLIPGMSVAGTNAGYFGFLSTVNGKTITTAGKTLYGVDFTGTGTWTLQDDLILTTNLYQNNGTLNTNNKNITCYNFTIGTTNIRQIILGSSVITCSDSFTLIPTNLTFGNGTSTIKMTGSGKLFDSGAKTCYNVEFQNNTTIVNSTTFNKLTLAASKILTLTNSTTTTVADLDIGNNATITATTSANLVYNGTASPTNMGTGVTTTNIVVTAPSAPANKRYWVGGSGNWSDTSHWSALSGFLGGFSLPASTTNVYFDADSFITAGQTVTVDVDTNCLDMDWTGATNTPSISGSANYSYIYGSLTLISGMTFGIMQTIYMRATTTGKTITTAGKIIQSIDFNSSSGWWTLQDTFNCSVIYLRSGSLNTNNQIVYGNFYSCYTTARTLTLGSTVWDYNYTWDMSITTNLTFYSGTSRLKNSSWSGGTFSGGGLNYNILEANTSINAVTITGSNTFNKLIINAMRPLTLTDGTTTTVNDLDIGDSVKISATTSATLSYTGTVGPTNMGTGVTKTNIVVTAPNAPANKRYWVGGTGNWSDTNHWSVLSDFFGGASVPTSAVDAYFDVDSFTATGQTVTVDANGQTCKILNWTGALNNPTLACGSNKLNVYSDITFINNMSVTGSYGLQVNAASTITSPVSIPGLYLAANGTFNLASNLTLSNYNLELGYGTLNTNNYDITMPNGILKLATGSSLSATVNLGSSEIHCTNIVVTNPGQLTLNAGTSIIYCSGVYSDFYGGGKSWYDLYFSVSGNVSNYLTIKDNNTFHSITLDSNYSLYFAAGTTTTITYSISAYSGSSLKVYPTGTPTYLIYNGGQDGIHIDPTTLSAKPADLIITTPNALAKRYWIGNGGNWSDTNHWSAFSGFFSGASVPISTVDAYFDKFSFTLTGQTVLLDVNANCQDIDWTEVTNVPTFSSGGYSLQVFGSLTFTPNMNNTLDNVYFSGALGTITTAGKTIASNTTRIEGDYVMNDNLLTGWYLQLSSGSLTTNDFYLRAGTVYVYNPFTLNAGNSVISISGTWNFLNTILTGMIFKDGKLRVNGNFNGGGASYNNVEISGNCSITGFNTFKYLKFSGTGTITLPANNLQGQDVSSFEAVGGPSGQIRICSYTAGSQARINCSDNLVYIKNCQVQDIAATGVIFNAVGCNNISNNSGWNFVDSIKIGELLPASIVTTGLMSVADKTKLYNKARITGETMANSLIAQSNTDYSVAQARNMILSTNDASVDLMNNGDVWIKLV